MRTDHCGLILEVMFYNRTIIHVSNPARSREKLGLSMAFLWSFASVMGYNNPFFFFHCFVLCMAACPAAQKRVGLSSMGRTCTFFDCQAERTQAEPSLAYKYEVDYYSQ